MSYAEFVYLAILALGIMVVLTLSGGTVATCLLVAPEFLSDVGKEWCQ